MENINILRKTVIIDNIARLSYETTLENQAHQVKFKGKKGIENKKRIILSNFTHINFCTMVRYKNNVY